MNQNSKFMELYNKVFNPDGSVKLCGRDACMDLIIICNSIDSGVNYGNVATGVMNIKAIQSLKVKLEEIT